MFDFNLNGSNVIAFNLILIELGFLLGFLVANKINNIKGKKKKGNKKCMK